MKFVLIKQPCLDTERAAWMVLVKSLEDLMMWFAWQPHTRDGVIDFFKVGRKEKQHTTTAVGVVLQTIDEHAGPIGALQMADILADTVLRPKVDALDKWGVILINVNGGFSPFMRDWHKITAEVESDRWPEVAGDVRVLQWAKGGHWYAKVGPHDVVVDGEQKWNSKPAALAAAGRFLQENGRQFFEEERGL